MARNVEFRSGAMTFTLSTDLTKEVEAAIVAAEKAIIAEVERERDAVLAAARKRWPEDTGVSKKGLVPYSQLDLLNGKFKSGVRNPVDYARFVRLGGPSDENRKKKRKTKGKRIKRVNALTALLRTPMKRAGKRLVKSIGPELQKAMNKELPTGK